MTPKTDDARKRRRRSARQPPDGSTVQPSSPDATALRQIDVDAVKGARQRADRVDGMAAGAGECWRDFLADFRQTQLIAGRADGWSRCQRALKTSQLWALENQPS
jgi:hypothetical protein